MKNGTGLSIPMPERSRHQPDDFISCGESRCSVQMRAAVRELPEAQHAKRRITFWTAAGCSLICGLCGLGAELAVCDEVPADKKRSSR